MSKTCSFPKGANRLERNGPRGHHVSGPLTKQRTTHCHLTLSLNNLRKVFFFFFNTFKNFIYLFLVCWALLLRAGFL